MTGERYLPVDRRNAFSWLSRGIIVPRALMNKYRPDALDAVPHALPVVLESMVGRLVTGVDLPVALELAPEVAFTGAKYDQESSVLLVDGALSARRITRIHVPTSSDAEEIAARAYIGFDGGELELSVNPRLFDISDADIDWADQASQQHFNLDDDGLRRREAVAGAIVLSASEVPLVDVAVLDGALSKVAGEDPIRALVVAAQQTGLVATQDDVELLQQVLVTLYEQTTQGQLVPSALLARLSDVMAESGIDGLEKHFRRIDQLIRGEDELQPFRPGGVLMTKALLLYLLRPDPEAIRGWAEEDLNADVEVLQLSRLLAGFASRYSGLPSLLRTATGSGELLDWVARGLQPNGFAISSGNSLPTHFGEEGGLEPQAEAAATNRDALIEDVRAGEYGRPIATAQALGWTDCLTLQVTSDFFDARTSGRRVRVAFAPGAKLDWLLLPDRFIDRLAAAEEADLAASMKAKRPTNRRAPRKRSIPNPS